MAQQVIAADSGFAARGRGLLPATQPAIQVSRACPAAAAELRRYTPCEWQMPDISGQK